LDTNTPSLNTARYALGGAGTQTAALSYLVVIMVHLSNLTQQKEYNGSTWTTSPGTLNTARRLLVGAGTQTAALAFGGYTTGPNYRCNRRI
jgi:hypothetical protein